MTASDSDTAMFDPSDAPSPPSVRESVQPTSLQPRSGSFGRQRAISVTTHTPQPPRLRSLLARRKENIVEIDSRQATPPFDLTHMLATTSVGLTIAQGLVLSPLLREQLRAALTRKRGPRRLRDKIGFDGQLAKYLDQVEPQECEMLSTTSGSVADKPQGCVVSPEMAPVWTQ